MNPSDYRSEFAAYCSALERERYRHHAGFTGLPDFRPVEERYSDLWTRGSIDDLRRALEETPAHSETERAGLSALLSVARLNHLEVSARGVTEELGRCAGSAKVEWRGLRVAAEELPSLIASDGDAAHRRELAARWFDAVRACDDLRIARLESLDEAARSLGFERARVLRDAVAGLELEKLAAAAGLFLERTRPTYASHLSRWAARQSPPLATNALSYADELFFENSSRFDHFFPSDWFVTAYDATLAGFGLRAESRRNVRVEAEARAGKRARTRCFAVSPPEEVRLVVGDSPGGAAWFRESLHEGGRAQAFGRASRDTATRHPEFIYAPDAATSEGHAALLSGLLRETQWHAEQRALRESEARAAAGHFALLDVHGVRRACARLQYWLALGGAGEARSEQSRETYAGLHTEATGFRYDPATALLDVEAAAHAASFLRARLFAAGLGEHLRARHGRRWYHSRAAGDELVDLWNTASRYGVEELARLVWGGGLDFDLLAETLTAAVND